MNINHIVKIETCKIGDNDWMIKAIYENGNNAVFGNVKTEKGAAARVTMYAKRFNLTKLDRFTAAR